MSCWTATCCLLAASALALAQPPNPPESVHLVAALAPPQSDTPRQAVVTGNPVRPAPAADDADPVAHLKQPTNWFNWGADLRLRQEYGDNPYLRDADPPGHVINWQRYRARLWSSITPVEQLEVNSRFIWEGRYTFNPDSREGWDPSTLLIDNLHVRIKSPDTALPFTLTVGRQDIRFGDGWLVFDGTSLDGSRTLYFDAVRGTFDLKSVDTTLDLVYLNQQADPDDALPPVVDVGSAPCKPVDEQDEHGGILYLTNRSIRHTTIEPYFIYKHDEATQPNGDSGDVYTLGTRATRALSKHWHARAEGAYQFGQRENDVLFPGASGDLSAFGASTRLTYLVRDKWDTQFHVGYEFLSGDDPDTRANEQFDPLWGRWPQWSDMMVYTFSGENRLGEVSNLHRFNLGAQTSPTRKLTLCANYNALFAPQNPRAGQDGFGDGAFRGHLLSAVAKVKFNRFVSGHLLGEYFLPGNFYSDDAGGPFESRDEPAAFVRVEMVFTF